MKNDKPLTISSRDLENAIYGMEVLLALFIGANMVAHLGHITI
jgi:hypothetical protein